MQQFSDTPSLGETALGVKGGSPPKISLTLPRPWSERWCSNGSKKARAACLSR